MFFSGQLSWIGSITNIGAMFGTVLFGYVTMFLGCKRAMLFLALPSIMFWIIIYFGDTYYHILFARFVSGWIDGGALTTVVLYISEISNDK